MEYLKGTKLRDIRLGLKGLSGTNALAYYEHLQITAVKSFITLWSGERTDKIFAQIRTYLHSELPTAVVKDVLVSVLLNFFSPLQNSLAYLFGANTRGEPVWLH